VKDFRAYFRSHPQVVAECAALVRIVDVNRATLALYGVKSKDDLLQNLALVFDDESYQHFCNELIHIAEGETNFDWEGVNQTLDGRRLHVSMRWSAAPGHEEDLSKVLVSIIDISERKQAEADLRRRADEFAALYETTRDLAEQQDLIPLLHTITERACALLRAPGGGVYLYDPARNQPLIVDDYRAWEGRAQQYQDVPFRAVIQAPMLYTGELIGVLAVEEIGESEHIFTQADLDLLMPFANQAAVAVQNARLFEEMRQRVAELEVLYESGLALGGLLEPHAIGQKIVEILAERLDWHHAVVRLCAARTCPRIPVTSRPIPASAPGCTRP